MDDFLQQILNRTSLKALVGRDVKLTPRGREAQGLCPFHHEKTPSFYVVEDKNFYHCFGCGKSGNAFNWLMEKHGRTFPEAVKELTQNAGLTIPENFFGRAQPKTDESLYKVLEAAAQYFEQCLTGPQGESARRYLQARKIPPEVMQKFRLGYAPDTAQFDDFVNFTDARGIKIDQLEKAGLAAVSQNDSAKSAQPRRYAHFRARLMFPINDKSGRIIGFGGRTLSNHKAKYINSPETELFHKGIELYRQHSALPEARKGAPLIVVEGYMDVIRLTMHGFTAVAPLGTAVSEMQLQRLWQASDAPVLCFDGDSAGRDAAYRAGLRALPHLTPNKSLQFCFLPQDQDPDSMLQAQGRETFEQYIDRALPLAEMLFAVERQKFPLRTPEARAGLEKQLLSHAGNIEDAIVSRHYRSFFKQKLWQQLQGRPTQAQHSPVMHHARRMPPTSDSQPLYQAVCLGLFLHPALYAQFEERLAKYSETPAHRQLFAALAQAVASTHPDNSEGKEFLALIPARTVQKLRHLFPGITQAQDDIQAEKTIDHIFAQLDYYQLQKEQQLSGLSAERQEQLRRGLDAAWQTAFDNDNDAVGQ